MLIIIYKREVQVVGTFEKKMAAEWVVNYLIRYRFLSIPFG